MREDIGSAKEQYSYAIGTLQDQYRKSIGCESQWQ